MWRSLKYGQGSREMENDDRRQIHGETARGNMQASGETESALMESLRRRRDRRVFKLSKREMETLLQPPVCQPATESERSCSVGHSEFNLCSVGSSDFVRLNPRPYLSTLSVDR